eukprot:TRINITY_DN8232_c0_g1_i1.p2 TRINITY_DN8232_c0_g1~~TRINITY_DN8232_c0_g1_i1.p2  ORF type:complete len:204 (-),score=36.25 TRINITY_DN8232_c0_g1_i1:248-859(-)
MPLQREIEVFDHTLLIEQEFSGELGATVWDAAIVLAKYLTSLPPGYFKNKRVIELGAGTGIVGLTCAFPELGAEVWITDLPKLLPLLSHNARINGLEKNVHIETLSWGEDVSSFSPPFDVILLSDVIAGCYKEDFAKLVKTLWDLSSKNTRIILSYELRSKEDLEFFKLVNEKFIYYKVDNSELDKVFQSEDIGIFEIKRRKE